MGHPPVYSPKVSLRSVRFEVTAQKGIQMRVVSFLIVLMCMAAPAMLAQTQKSFPTDDEINLLLTQTERAIQQYKPLIDQEQVQMGRVAHPFPTNELGAPSFRSLIAEGWENAPPEFQISTAKRRCGQKPAPFVLQAEGVRPTTGVCRKYPSESAQWEGR